MTDPKTDEEWKIARLRATLESLRDDAQSALSRKQSPGGQHVGMPVFMGCSVTVLRQIERDCRHALEESEGDLSWFKEYHGKR